MSADRDRAAGPPPCNELASAYPDARQFVHARRWLAWLAFRMKDDTSLLWWRVPLWLPHARIRTAYQVLLAVGLAVAFWGPIAIITRQPGGQVLWLVPFGALVGVAFGTKVATTSRLYSAVPLRIVPRWPRLQGWVVLVLCVVVPVLLVPSLLRCGRDRRPSDRRRHQSAHIGTIAPSDYSAVQDWWRVSGSP